MFPFPGVVPARIARKAEPAPALLCLPPSVCSLPPAGAPVWGHGVAPGIHPGVDSTDRERVSPGQVHMPPCNLDPWPQFFPLLGPCGLPELEGSIHGRPRPLQLQLSPPALQRQPAPSVPEFLGPSALPAGPLCDLG